MNEHIGIEATTAASGDISTPSLLLVTGVLLVIFLIGVFSTRITRLRSYVVRHLFLKTTLRQNGQDLVAYIRELTPEGAVIVTSTPLEKHSKIEMNLGALPDFPIPQLHTICAVQSNKPLGGQPSNYLVRLTFEKQSSDSGKPILLQYLKNLHST